MAIPRNGFVLRKITSLPFLHFIMADDSKLKSELQTLSKRCWKTSASRFEASRRMRRCSNASTLCVAMLSVEIIVINLLVFIPSLRLDGNLVTIVTVCLSAFVLVLSLIITHLKYDRREDAYHQCGLRLGDLEKKINIFEASDEHITKNVLEEFNKQYQSILRESNLNHTEIDMERAMRNTDEVKEAYKANPIKWFFRNSWLSIRWHLFRPDSTYNLLTLIGAVIILLVIFYGKENDSITSANTLPEMIINLNGIAE